MSLSRSLDELGWIFGTDKASSFHGYLPWYEQFLSPMREEPVRLFEMGVWKGASMRMWAKYFPRGRITGFDIDPACLAVADDRIRVLIGNQSVPMELPLDEQFDIIIDDAGHDPNSQIIAFQALTGSCLKQGGFYLIEDVWDQKVYQFVADLISSNHPKIGPVEYYRGKKDVSRAIVIWVKPDEP